MMLVAAPLPKEVNAISYYRVEQPLLEIDRSQRDWMRGTKLNAENPKPKEVMALQQADVCFSHFIYASPMFWEKGAKDAILGRLPLYERGVMHHPPVLVVTLDDLYAEVGVYNPAFGEWGIHRPDGTMLEPGDKIFELDPNGKERPIWVDGESAVPGDETEKFSVMENIQRVASTTEFLNHIADALVISTPTLAKNLENYCVRPKNMFISPNCMCVEDWDEFEPAPHEGVRILWQGGASHFEDLFTILKPMKALAEKYPQTQWIFWGQKFVKVLDIFPPSQVKWIDWVPYERHRLKLSTIGHDINLCPLKQSPFNDCKSGIKFYESSMTASPAATVAVKLPPFEDVLDGETGMTYSTPEEFYQKMSVLIEDATLRKALGLNAKQWVLQNRNIANEAPRLANFFKQVREDQVKAWPKFAKELVDGGLV